jgi:hypothetical protein
MKVVNSHVNNIGQLTGEKVEVPFDLQTVNPVSQLKSNIANSWERLPESTKKGAAIGVGMLTNISVLYGKEIVEATGETINNLREKTDLDEKVGAGFQKLKDRFPSEP